MGEKPKAIQLKKGHTSKRKVAGGFTLPRETSIKGGNLKRGWEPPGRGWKKREKNKFWDVRNLGKRCRRGEVAGVFTPKSTACFLVQETGARQKQV